MAVNEQYWRSVISGENSSLLAFVLRGILRAASCVYAAVTVARRKLYDMDILKSVHPNRAVVSIGNITTGGTGKTPAVAWVVSELKRMGVSAAVVTRGYRAVDGISDEAAMLADKDCEVYVNPDRLSAAFVAISKGAKMIVMDDGYQHLRLQRDLNIAILDATEAFGYGYLLPRGLLREPVSVLKYADVVIVSRCDLAGEEVLTDICERIKSVSNAEIVRSVMAPSHLRMPEGGKCDASSLKGKKIFAFCGIGNPDAFFATLKSCGCELAGELVFNDHHDYTAGDLDDIKNAAANCGAEITVTTAKDAVKTARLACGDAFGVLEIELEFSQADADMLRAKLAEIYEKYE